MRLRDLRLREGLTQEQLAVALSTSQQAIFSYERGVYEPDINMLTKMAQFFHTSIDYIVELVDVETPIQNIKPHELTEAETRLIRFFRNLPTSVQSDISGLVSHLENLHWDVENPR